jgi:hypothetical protein
MRRLLLTLAIAAAAAGCVSASPGGPLMDGPFVNPGGDPPTVYPQPKPGALTRVGNAILSVPETVVWWPYKIVSSAARGAYDGVAGGVEKAPMPIVGVLAFPLTGAAGVVNGALSGVGRGPAYVGNTAEFGQALGRPWSEPIPLFGPRR